MEPKYKIGDKVWLVAGDRAFEGEIYGVRSDLIGVYQPEFSYLIKERVLDAKGATQWFYEFKIFPTKQDLINSL